MYADGQIPNSDERRYKYNPASGEVKRMQKFAQINTPQTSAKTRNVVQPNTGSPLGRS